ncbi:molybdopterin oxidoreductase [Novimethylophilus kurashikiensis]|uniref:Molybdopterin oxidoreductase n=1 Tax=Novimethylophilus kurashikiensis TaxID=1825523 RepID=A0A2R5FC82_9PROT|nr:hypothetical protein [Novimethylophilus kurashikiensis]GBG14543.1 molybdopterin oxidoreductase [Novimethylophilus kurashikiensis]
MLTVNTTLPKLCHAKVGAQVRIPDPKTGEILPEIFLVTAIDEPKRKPARPGLSYGLYDDQRKLLLVSLTTGIARAMPHLSSRVEIVKEPIAPDDITIHEQDTVDIWYRQKYHRFNRVATINLASRTSVLEGIAGLEGMTIEVIRGFGHTAKNIEN